MLEHVDRQLNQQFQQIRATRRALKSTQFILDQCPELFSDTLVTAALAHNVNILKSFNKKYENRAMTKYLSIRRTQ